MIIAITVLALTTQLLDCYRGKLMYKSERYYVPIHEKANLTLDEAAAYFNIGRDKIRKLTDDPDCQYVLFVGEKRLIKRRLFEKFLEDVYSI